MPQQKSKPLSKICEDFIFKYFNRNKSCCCFRFSDTHDTFQGRGHGVVLSKAPSDFIVTNFGRVFFAEVKSTENLRGTTKKLFDQQAARRNQILTAGGDYEYFVYSEARDKWYVLAGQAVRNCPTRTWEDLDPYSTPVQNDINKWWQNR